MTHVLSVVLKDLDSAIKHWFNETKPYSGGTWKAPKCPVCGETCKYDTDYMGHTMLEEHTACPNHHYAYDFVNGSTETRVGAVIVHGYYADSEAEKDHQDRMISLALIHMREEWRKQNEEQHEGRS